MKHLALCGALAALLAALLAGCGAKTAASARPAGSRELKSTPPDSMHATAAITEQYTLEKVVQAENGGKVRLNIHLPRLESDSADAARINAEIARYYEYDVQEYVDCPAAADPDVWDICIEMNWNASWYGDCVSLVVSSCYGGTDAPFHNGWCFDFESGNQLTATQLLQRMGADPAALEEALYRDVKRRDELDRQAHEIHDRDVVRPGRVADEHPQVGVGHARQFQRLTDGAGAAHGLFGGDVELRGQGAQQAGRLGRRCGGGSFVVAPLHAGNRIGRIAEAEPGGEHRTGGQADQAGKGETA